MSCVFPGAADVLASFVLLQSILINEDLPTLLLPINAYSGLSGFGHLSTDGLEIRYVALVISIGLTNSYAKDQAEYLLIINQ